MTKQDLRQDFHNEQGIKWENLQGEPDIDYVEWLENKILAVKNNAVLPHVSNNEVAVCDAPSVNDCRHADGICSDCQYGYSRK